MSASDVEELLRGAMGLDAASIGSASIERAVQERERACGREGASYLEHVRGSAAELQALVEAIVVPETWFFRDTEAFAALAAVAAAEAPRASPERPLRLLSVPCSSGEEPYSMAITLLESGLAGDRFCIDAVDISLRALQRAEAGLYGRNSFRGSELGFRERYFTQTPDGHRLLESVQAPVRLRHGNLAGPGLLGDGAPYDVIFCRNLLIYFDRELQDRTAHVLLARLREGGWLFAGAAEGPLWLRMGLVSARLSHSFAFRRASAPAPAAAGVPRALPAAAPKPAPAPRRPAQRPRAAAPRGVEPRSAPAGDCGAELAAAEQLADQGRLAEAIELCERQLRAHGPQLRTLYLLGLAHDAEGHAAQAEEFYRKTLYLEPTHCEALIHLACLLERQGDADGARRLRERAARAERRSGEVP